MTTSPGWNLGLRLSITSAVSAHALSIDGFTSRTLDAPMAGGILFEATVSVRVPDDQDAAPIVTALERLADEIQVDLSLG
jgi:glycine cleavage system regulatory protein